MLVTKATTSYTVSKAAPEQQHAQPLLTSNNDVKTKEKPFFF